MEASRRFATKHEGLSPVPGRLAPVFAHAGLQDGLALFKHELGMNELIETRGWLRPFDPAACIHPGDSVPWVFEHDLGNRRPGGTRDRPRPL